MRNSTFKKWRARQKDHRDKEELRALLSHCFHEAAHCVMDELFLKGVEYAEVCDKEVEGLGTSNGFTQTRPRPLSTTDDFERECISSFAGPIAEDMFTGKASKGDIHDMKVIAAFGRYLNLPPDEIIRIGRKGQDNAITLLRNDVVWAAVKEIAILLATTPRVSGDQVRAMVDKHGREEMMGLIPSNAPKS